MVQIVENNLLFPGTSGEAPADTNVASRPMFLERKSGVAAQVFATTEEFASLVIEDITYTALLAGEAGNDITIAYVDDGVSGSETVDVTGTDIVVHMDDTAVTGSTAQDIYDAVQASDDALALISAEITGTASDVQAAHAEAPLTGGAGVTGSLFLQLSNSFSPDGEQTPPTESEWSTLTTALVVFDGSGDVNFMEDITTKARWARLLFVPTAGSSPEAVFSGRYQSKD